MTSVNQNSLTDLKSPTWYPFNTLEFSILRSDQSFRLCLVPRKFEGKCKRKKIQRKSRRKEKVKENKKID